MLTLSNGHKFSVATAAGALAYDGRGYFWERYGLIPLGVIDPSLFTIITKTLTFLHREGNVRWWRPCVWPLLPGGGAVNQMGLPNPGLLWLMERHQKGLFPVPGLPTIVSITPWDVAEAKSFGLYLNQIREIKGIEINVSCPNVAHEPLTTEEKVVFVRNLLAAVKGGTSHPVGIKLGYLDPYREICDALDGEADWFNLINTVPWKVMYPKRRTPLKPWGLDGGGVSGPQIAGCALDALVKVTMLKADDSDRTTPLRTPIISGGGITTAREGLWRLQNGAAAVTVGTMFLTRPWRVNGIARGIIEGEKNAR